MLALDRVIENEIEGEALDELRRRLSQRIGLDSHDSFVAALRARADIRIYEDRIAAENEPYTR